MKFTGKIETKYITISGCLGQPYELSYHDICNSGQYIYGFSSYPERIKKGIIPLKGRKTFNGKLFFHRRFSAWSVTDAYLTSHCKYTRNVLPFDENINYNAIGTQASELLLIALVLRKQGKRTLCLSAYSIHLDKFHLARRGL